MTTKPQSTTEPPDPIATRIRKQLNLLHQSLRSLEKDLIGVFNPSTSVAPTVEMSLNAARVAIRDAVYATTLNALCEPEIGDVPCNVLAANIANAVFRSLIEVPFAGIVTLRSALQQIKDGTEGNSGRCMDCDSAHVVADDALKAVNAAASPVAPVEQSDELVDEVQHRMDQVIGAAVEWHQAGREGGEWFEAAEKLGAAINSLLELRDGPQSRMPRRWCSVHNREEFKYESLEHELHAAPAPSAATQDEAGQCYWCKHLDHGDKACPVPYLARGEGGIMGSYPCGCPHSTVIPTTPTTEEGAG